MLSMVIALQFGGRLVVNPQSSPRWRSRRMYDWMTGHPNTPIPHPCNHRESWLGRKPPGGNEALDGADQYSTFAGLASARGRLRGRVIEIGPVRGGRHDSRECGKSAQTAKVPIYAKNRSSDTHAKLDTVDESGSHSWE
jgi:hypothetical protein